MSSIIDALKKSDKNRNNESSANLNAIKFGQNPPQKSKRGFWLLVLLLLLVATGIYAWTQGWHNKLMQFTQSWTSQTTEQATTHEQLTIVDGNKADEIAEQKPIKRQLSPPKQSDIKAKTAQLNKQQDASTLAAKESTNASTDDNESDIKPLTRSQENTKSSKKADSDDQTDSVSSDEVRKTDSSDEQAEEEKQAKDKKYLQPKLQQDYLLLHQIDFAIRKNIPKVKINIHIYDPLPENRMVLINGERFNIGDTIDDLLTIEDIVQEGVVLKFENVKFLIPK